MRVTTSGYFTDPPLMCVLSVFGVDRVIFSVDYPYADNKEGVAFLEAAPISEVDREKIAHGNVEALLGLQEHGRVARAAGRSRRRRGALPRFNDRVALGERVVLAQGQSDGIGPWRSSTTLEVSSKTIVARPSGRKGAQPGSPSTTNATHAACISSARSWGGASPATTLT
jgi:hypothetical protein